MHLQQDPQITQIIYTPKYTLSIIVGLLGGISSAIFGILPFIVDWYQQFRVKNEVIQHLYKYSAEEQELNPIDLKQKIATYMPFKFSFKEYLRASLDKLCCCCRNDVRRSRLEKFE